MEIQQLALNSKVKPRASENYKLNKPLEFLIGDEFYERAYKRMVNA